MKGWILIAFLVVNLLAMGGTEVFFFLGRILTVNKITTTTWHSEKSPNMLIMKQCPLVAKELKSLYC